MKIPNTPSIMTALPSDCNSWVEIGALCLSVATAQFNQLSSTTLTLVITSKFVNASQKYKLVDVIGVC